MKFSKTLSLILLTTASLVSIPAMAEDDIIYADITFANDTSYVSPFYFGLDKGKKTGDKKSFGDPTDEVWGVSGIGDVDGDGWDDIVWQYIDGKSGPQEGQVVYWRMVDGKRAGAHKISTPVGNDWHLQGVGDVDGDGTADIIWQHDSGQVHYWKMKNGHRVSGQDIVHDIPSDHKIHRLDAIGDMNGDGTDDFIWHNEDSGQVYFWKMKEGRKDGVFQIGIRNFHNNAIIDAGDMDGDGTDDLVWEIINSPKGDHWAWWKMKDGKHDAQSRLLEIPSMTDNLDVLGFGRIHAK